jgi:hypothetical protein
MPDSTDDTLFDRVIPEARWAGYAIHRLEFWDIKQPKWTPTALDPEPADVLSLFHDHGT